MALTRNLQENVLLHAKYQFMPSKLKIQNDRFQWSTLYYITVGQESMWNMPQNTHGIHAM